MSFFSKLLGKSSTMPQKKEQHNYDSVLDFIIIYKGYEDSDNLADQYTALEDELWGYDCIGESGAMFTETAKKYGIPLPMYPDFPLIGVFDFHTNNGNKKGYENPLFISSKKEEVKCFLEEYEKNHE
jgi:hypothetical protein